MDFTIPEELRALRKSYATFLDREIRPIEEGLFEDLTGLDPDRDRLYEGALAAVAADVVGLLDEPVPGQQPQVVAAGARRQPGHLRALGRGRGALQLQPFQDRVPTWVGQRAHRAGVGQPLAVPLVAHGIDNI